ncbi:hypothetical protein Bca101_059782 [Brassica carinata]
MSLDVNRALSVGLGGSTDSIGESGGWMVWKGMHTHQFLQQRTGLTTKQRETLLLDIYKAQMQFWVTLRDLMIYWRDCYPDFPL